MPIFADSEKPIGRALETVTGRPLSYDPWKAQPGFVEALAPAFRLDNPVVSTANWLLNAPGMERDENHNPLTTIKGTKYEAEHMDRFIMSPNESYTRWLMQKIDAEDKDRETLAKAGFAGYVATFGVGLLDPIFMIPMGAAVAATKGGVSALRTAGKFAAVGAGQSVVSEGVLQATQASRPMSESLVNISSNAILMGILGGAAGLLRPEQAARLEAQIDDLRGLKPEGAGGSGAVPPAGEGVPAPGSMSGYGPQPGGAAVSDVRTLEPQSILGGLEKVPGIGKIVTGTSPTMRGFFGKFKETRLAMAELAETGVRFVDNKVGLPTSIGIPISRLVQMDYVRYRLKTSQVIRDIWAEMTYGQNVPVAPIARNNFDRWMGNAADGPLDYQSFKERVGRAASNADLDEDPFVTRAAQKVRAEVLNPILELAQAGDNPLIKTMGELKPKGDQSFGPRSYKSEAIRRDPLEFQRRVANFYEKQQEIKQQAQDRLAAMNEKYKQISKDVRALESRLDGMASRIEKTGERLSERSMERGATMKRSDMLTRQAVDIGESVSEMEEFIDAMKREISDPATAEHLARLEDELKTLKRSAEPVTEAEVRKLNDADVKELLPDELDRVSAEMAIGKRRMPEVPSILGWIRKKFGGVNDVGGELSAIVGGRNRMPGLINKNGVDLDAIGEEFQQMAPGYFPERPLVSDVLDIIDAVNRGNPPEWWLQGMMKQRDIELLYRANQWTELLESPEFTSSPRQVTNLQELVQELLLAEEKNPRLLDRFYAQADAPEGVRQTRDSIKAVNKGQTAIRRALTRGRNAVISKRRQEAKAAGKASESGVAATRNLGRERVLAERLERQQVIRDVHDELRSILQGKADDIRKTMEDEVRTWQGNSSADAMRALSARDKAYAEGGGVKGRLKSADKDVDSFVRRVIESNRNLSRAELDARAAETRERIMNDPEGRLPYEDASAQRNDAGGPAGDIPLRGSLHGRGLAMASSDLGEFLETDIEKMIEVFLKRTLPDIAIHNRFGDVEMREVFRKINDEYQALVVQTDREMRAAGKKPREIAKAMDGLKKEHAKSKRDLAAVRDRIRGVYAFSGDYLDQRLARAANVTRDYLSVVSLGTAAVNSAPDAGGVVFQYGLTSTFRDGWVPFFQHMRNMPENARGFNREKKAFGIGVETELGIRRQQIADIADQYEPGTQFEKWSRWGADKFQIANLQAPETDMFKRIASYVSSHNLLRMIENQVAGKASQKEIETLAAASITPDWSRRIWAAFKDGGGDKIEGVRLPDFGDWKDKEASRKFGSVLARDNDLSVVVPGQERPLLMSKPVIGLLFTFKSFIAAIHERLLIPSLQRRDAEALQGMFTMLGLGILSYKLYTMVSGKKFEDNPAQIVKEGASRAGLLGWGDEANAITSKLTGGKMDIYRLIGADKPLSRYANRNIMGTLLGPMAGKVSDVASVTRAVATGETNAGDISAARRLLYLQNHFALRRMLDEVEDATAGMLGVEPKQRD